MTELSFLIELLLNHDLPKATKDLIAQRIKEVEQNLTKPQVGEMRGNTYWSPGALAKEKASTVNGGVQQAPSTLALMAKHGDIPPQPLPQETFVEPPVAVIAQTQATAAAMQSRNQAIADSIAGKTDKATGRPRKW